MIEVGSRVLTTDSHCKELIGLRGTVIKQNSFKPEYVSTFRTDEFFRVKFDSPVSVYGEMAETGLFKKTDLMKI